ncbi:DEAD/DEAH box helicase family protein [Stenotrophomonas maltophilia]|nr:DEAD/DEAH box helicase family protein [Stenotrophomonas maltophilia]
MLTTGEEFAVAAAMREGQRRAANAVREYLARDYAGKSFLVVMPTGAGKSGLIASVCQSHPRGPIVVLSPRAAVCRQLMDEISGKFFSDRGVLVESPRSVKELGGESKEDCIYVGTFQKLIRMKSTAFRRLAESCSLLIVDEGHSEPAPLWGKAVRQFSCHKIIVTATPYRNDLFQFDIGLETTFCYTFKKAVEHQVILEPAFEPCTIADAAQRTSIFLSENPTAKAIVKAKSLGDVKMLKELMDGAGLSALAIHDKLPDDTSAGTAKTVPSGLNSRDVRVVIHQRKLDEGVDLPSAKLCVLTYPVASGRELVQTVGRIVRKFESIQPLVLDCGSSSNTKMWANYLEFDSSISSDDGWAKFVNSLDTAKLIESYLDTFPQYMYLGAAFREKFELLSLDVDRDIRVPTASVCFLGVEEGFTIESFVDAMLWRNDHAGELAKCYDSAHGFKVIVSIRFESSKYLKSKLFFEPSLHVVVAKKIGNYLAVFDSRSINHAGDTALGTKQPVDPQRLFNLSARGAFTRVKETHARSISSARRRPERVSHVGPELSASYSGQSAASYALSVTKVDNLDLTQGVESSYYLSTGSGRVSDQKNGSFSLERLSEWVDEVASVLDEDAPSLSPVIGAFALPIDAMAVSGPLSMTIDFTDLPAGTKMVSGAKSTPLDAGFLFLECPNWKVKVGSSTLRFAYIEEVERIVFTASPDVMLVSPDGEAVSLVQDMNSRSLKILFADGVSYVDGKFYKSALPTTVGIDLESTVIGASIYPVPELQLAGLSEKGLFQDREYVGTSAENFDANSVFNLIDSLARGDYQKYRSTQYDVLRRLVPDIDLVVCTDMGTEAADFIVSSPKSLCFLHVKCGDSKRPKSPAGALAEVGAQAIKNIEYLVSSNESLPFGNEGRLALPWPHRSAIHKLKHRVRFMAKDGVERTVPSTPKAYSKCVASAIETIKKRRRSPGCKKEVWIVAANSFSYGSFKKEIKMGAAAKAESLQAYQLIDAWLAVCSANDVDLKIMVSP